MQRYLPKYRINYRYCQENQHQQEKANLICLEKSCVDNPLICSFCIQERHKGHFTKPLKHFLQNLEKKYTSSSQTNLDKELEQLEYQKYIFMDKIQKAVQFLATQFQELEQEILRQYDLIRSQLITKQINKNRFKEFYHKMAFQGKGDPNFQIQNYLNFDPILSFSLNDGIDELISQTNKNFEQLKRKLVVKQNIDFTLMKSEPLVKITDQSQQKFVIPYSIVQVGNVFSQEKMTNKQTLCYLSKFLKDWTGKLRIKVLQLQQISELTIGIALAKDLIDSKHQFRLKNNPKCYYLNSKGVSHHQSVNYIKSIKSGDIIDVTIKKNKCKISLKGDICNFDIIDKNNSMFFFNLQGICQIQVLYPYKKQQ